MAEEQLKELPTRPPKEGGKYRVDIEGSDQPRCCQVWERRRSGGGLLETFHLSTHPPVGDEREMGCQKHDQASRQEPRDATADSAITPASEPACPAAWEVQVKGEKCSASWEISVIRKDNEHGHRSWGWFDDTKLLVSHNGGPCDWPIVEFVWDAQIRIAHELCDKLNSGEIAMKKTLTNSEAVLGYLKGRDWTSPTELGRAIWGKGHHSSSASPVCLRLVKAGKLERNAKGHYRLSDRGN